MSEARGDSVDAGVRLRELVDSYAAAVDRADATAVAELFTPDGELVLFMQPGVAEPTGVRRGRSEIESALRGLSGYRATHHTISSHVVLTLGEQVATGETRCVAHHVEADGNGWRDRVLYATYRDSYRRDDGEWRFARRELRVQWVSLLPVVE